jgi:AcrR family transcriptional regulator
MSSAPHSASPLVSIEGYRHGRVPRALREQQLLDVAEEVFTELGFDGTSIEELSRRGGIKRPLFYTYFGGKEGLYLACHRRARADMEQCLAAGAAEIDPAAPDAPRRIIDRVIRAYFEFIATSPRRWDMIHGPGEATAGPIADEVAALRFQTVELLAAMIRQHAPAGTSEQAILAFAHATSGAGEQLTRWWRRSPDVTIDQVAELGVRYVWAGLGQLLKSKPR